MLPQALHKYWVIRALEIFQSDVNQLSQSCVHFQWADVSLRDGSGVTPDTEVEGAMAGSSHWERLNFWRCDVAESVAQLLDAMGGSEF